MLKNAITYQVTSTVDVAELNSEISTLRFSPPEGFVAESSGFEPYQPDLDLAHEENGVILLCVRTDKKMVPASAVKEAVKEKAAAIEQTQGYKPGRAQLREIKEDVTDDLVSRALAATTRTFVYLYSDRLVIDTSSAKRAELIMGLFSKALDHFPFALISTETSPASAMTQWLTDDAPEGFSLDDEAEMLSSGESGARVKWTRQMVDAAHASEHHAEGKECVRLAMTWEDKISFVFTQGGLITRIKFLDLVNEQAETGADACLSADVALYLTELRQLIDRLENSLGGLRAPF